LPRENARKNEKWNENTQMHAHLQQSAHAFGRLEV
jgi:hypothetical protein